MKKWPRQVWQIESGDQFDSEVEAIAAQREHTFRVETQKWIERMVEDALGGDELIGDADAGANYVVEVVSHHAVALSSFLLELRTKHGPREEPNDGDVG